VRRFSSFPQGPRLTYSRGKGPGPVGTYLYLRQQMSPFATVLQSAACARTTPARGRMGPVSPTTADDCLLSVGPILLRGSRSRTRRDLDRGRRPNIGQHLSRSSQYICINLPISHNISENPSINTSKVTWKSGSSPLLCLTGGWVRLILKHSSIDSYDNWGPTGVRVLRLLYDSPVVLIRIACG